jgi:hypothetical protein
MASLSSCKKYAQIAENMCAEFFPHLSKISRKRIASVVFCTHAVDNYVDAEPGVLKKRRQQNILNYWNTRDASCFEADQTELVEKLQNLVGVLDDLPPDRQDKFIENVQKIFMCGDVLSTTRQASRFTQARIEEGRRTANLLILAVDEFSADPNAARFYQSVCGYFNLFDTLKDFSKDKRGREINLPVIGLFRVAAVSFGGVAVLAVTSPKQHRRIVSTHVAKVFDFLFKGKRLVP